MGSIYFVTFPLALVFGNRFSGVTPRPSLLGEGGMGRRCLRPGESTRPFSAMHDGRPTEHISAKVSSALGLPITYCYCSGVVTP